MNGRPVFMIAPAPHDLTDVGRGNVLPLLHEIRHALARLLASGESTRIDLRALPLGSGEEAALEAALGTGEVEATLDVLGQSRIAETAHAGVWLVTHRDESGQVVGRFIEIARAPEILCSQTEDIAAGLQRLAAHLDVARPVSVSGCACEPKGAS